MLYYFSLKTGFPNFSEGLHIYSNKAAAIPPIKVQALKIALYAGQFR